MSKPIVEGIFKLEKFQGKGGWTYIALPALTLNSNTSFGWRRVRGSIDAYNFKNYHLMPMGNGRLFLPVNATIRRQIFKKEGDSVTVVLFEDTDPLEVPDELIICLKDEPKAYQRFMKLGEGYKKEFINWVYAAKREETKASRIAGMIEKLLAGETLSKMPIK